MSCVLCNVCTEYSEFSRESAMSSVECSVCNVVCLCLCKEQKSNYCQIFPVCLHSCGLAKVLIGLQCLG